jgi:hypothetical protein
VEGIPEGLAAIIEGFSEGTFGKVSAGGDETAKPPEICDGGFVGLKITVPLFDSFFEDLLLPKLGDDAPLDFPFDDDELPKLLNINWFPLSSPSVIGFR